MLVLSAMFFLCLRMVKETTLERADLAFQLLIFVTAEKERRMFIIFFLSVIFQLLSPQFSARIS